MEEFVANVEINSFFSNYMNLGQLHISLNEQALYLIKLFGPSKHVPGSWSEIPVLGTPDRWTDFCLFRKNLLIELDGMMWPLLIFLI